MSSSPRSTLSTLADIPFIAVFLLLVASIAGPIVFAIIAGGILMILPAYFVQRKMIALTKQSQGASARSGRLLHEVLTELDTLKTQRGEERMLKTWCELNEIAAQSTAEQRRLSARLTYWSQAVQQGTYIAAVVLGTYMVFAGEFTVGTIIATGILTSRTLAPLNVFAGTLARWGNVKNALDGLKPSPPPRRKRMQAAAICAANVCPAGSSCWKSSSAMTRRRPRCWTCPVSRLRPDSALPCWAPTGRASRPC